MKRRFRIARGPLIAFFAAAVLLGLVAFVALAPRSNDAGVQRARESDPFAVLTSKRSLDTLRDYSARTFDRYPGCSEVEADREAVTCQGARRIMTIGTQLAVVFVGGVGIQVVRAEITRAPRDSERILEVTGRAGALGQKTRVLERQQFYLGVDDVRHFAQSSGTLRATRFDASAYTVRFAVPKAALERARATRAGLRFTFTWPGASAAGAKRIGVISFPVPPDPT